MAKCMTTIRRKDAVKGVVAGLAGGLVASWTMNQFQALVSRATNGSSQQSASDDENATERLAQTLAEKTIDRRLSKKEIGVAAPVVHYAYGTLMGGVYGAAAERSTGWQPLTGAAYGALLWAAGDELAVPLLGLSRPSTEFPIGTHVQALAAHIVYGVTTELVRRGIRGAM
jgi:putative membrane protein